MLVRRKVPQAAHLAKGTSKMTARKAWEWEWATGKEVATMSRMKVEVWTWLLKTVVSCRRSKTSYTKTTIRSNRGSLSMKISRQTAAMRITKAKFLSRCMTKSLKWATIMRIITQWVKKAVVAKEEMILTKRCTIK